MSNFWDKYALILTTTKHIVLNPFEFGETIGDSPADSKRAAVYLGEGAIFFYSLFQLSNFGSTSDLPYADAPFAGEIIAAVLIFSAVVMALVTHPIARWFSDGNTTLHASLASFLYWSGFCLFIIPPFMVALITGSQWLFASLPYGENIRFFSFMAVGVPFMFVYYIGTISNWIGSTYKIEPIMGGISVALAYVVSSGIGATLAAVASLAVGSPG
ncbi:MAG: hypothetical protein KJ622_14475 [Alphaproteobacteria bacterium]|nr:hypothetical protein [Alphaproteobacteria bacterium]